MSTAEKYDLAGGPAFPVSDPCEHAGMTLRDYFAAKALPTCISLAQNRDGGWDAISAATAAYAVADAMLEEREMRAQTSS